MPPPLQKSTAPAVACCNVAGFILALYSIFSSSWVWGRGIVFSDIHTTRSTIGTGPYIASYGSKSVSTQNQWGWSSYTMWYDEIRPEACKNTTMVSIRFPYLSESSLDGQEEWNKFFCNDNNELVIPSELDQIRNGAIAAIVLSFVASILGFMIIKGSKKVAVFAGVLSFSAFISATVSYAGATGFDYYQGVRDGSASLLVPASGNVDNPQFYFVANFNEGLWWGAGFWSMVVASITFLVTAFLFCGLAKIPEEPEFDGAYADNTTDGNSSSYGIDENNAGTGEANGYDTSKDNENITQV